jgi:hypothetical protein
MKLGRAPQIKMIFKFLVILLVLDSGVHWNDAGDFFLDSRLRGNDRKGRES